MRSVFSRICYMTLLFVGMTGSISVSATEFSIATGGQGGIYYPVGRALCKLMPEDECDAVETKGSIENLLALRAKKHQFALAQSDWQYHSFKGTSKFKKAGPHESLRALFSLHNETFSVLVRTKSGIREFSELAGKRINLGVKGEGHRATFEIGLLAMGWNAKSFSKIAQLGATEGAKALCNNDVDAIGLAVGHPSLLVLQTTKKCRVRLVDVIGPGISNLLEKRPYYQKTEIPAGTYPGMTNKVRSFGISATLVTDESVDEELVYEFVRNTFENIEKFKNSHKALKFLETGDMAKSGLTAPLHKGALRYYREAGIL